MGRNTELVELLDVTRTFVHGDITVHALKGISLTIERGEFVAIMGPSGSGKSTLMHILGCLDRPTSGKYILDGVDVGSLDDDAISAIRSRYIGFVFQSFYLVPYLTVLDNVLLPVQYLDPSRRRELFSRISPEKKARQLLEELGVGDRIKFKPDQLSGGQKQRVAIARALMNSPEIILADEPTGQLDAESSRAVMEIFKRLNGSGKTVVIVTHDPSIARSAERILRIEDGRIV